MRCPTVAPRYCLAEADTVDELADAMAEELRRMVVRCANCGKRAMCEPCRSADRLLARYDALTVS